MRIHVLRWLLNVEGSNRHVATRTFAEAAHAWRAVETLAAEFEAEGFVAHEIEAVRYGERWLQRLVRGSTEVVVHLERARVEPVG